jgi:glycerophosphoryl diester phosphodiesterase
VLPGLVVGLLFGLAACVTTGKESMSSQPLMRVAHRGGAALAPENTMAAFRLALEYGVDALELDVHLSRDGRLAVIHDPTLARTTNQPGQVADFTLAELKGFDASARFFGKAYGTQPIPVLEEVLELLARAEYRHVVLQLEVKVRADGNRYEGIEAEIIRLLGAYGMIERTIILCFDFPTLRTIAELEPRLQRCALIGRAYLASIGKAGPAVVAEEIAALSVEYVGVREDSLSRPLYDALRGKGLRIGAWTVNELPRMQELKQLGVDFITSDRPDLLQDLAGR